MNESNEENIYAKLKKIRESRGLTVDNLAKKMGENHQKVGRIERGARTLTVDYLMKVSKALDTPIETLLTKEAMEPRQPKVLNEIVVLVEKTFPNITAEQKGGLISSIYQETLKFPETHQSLFAQTVFELIKFVGELELPKKN
jgi:transcriptional regulator with XRE-family HTH domain